MAYQKSEKQARNPLFQKPTLEDEYHDPIDDIIPYGMECEEANEEQDECNPEAVFDAFEKENNPEGATWGQSEGYFSSTIYTGLTEWLTQFSRHCTLATPNIQGRRR
jgi:hypothetical protein